LLIIVPVSKLSELGKSCISQVRHGKRKYLTTFVFVILSPLGEESN
jgi:hypothetical protein